MLKSLVTIFLVITLFQYVNSNCLFDWDNTCRTNADCCSNFCDNNNGQWAHGICKSLPQIVSKSINLDMVSITTTTTTKTLPTTTTTDVVACFDDWYDRCNKDSDCCSNICENKNGKWKNGVCKPKPTTRKTHTTFKINLSCRKDWYDRCYRDSECCSNICDKHNNNKWEVGVCTPKRTTLVSKPIKLQTKPTKRKQLLTTNATNTIINRQEKLLPKCECICSDNSYGICKP